MVWARLPRVSPQGEGGTTPVKAGGALERVSRPQYARVVKRPTGNLERERQAPAPEAA